MLLDPERTIPVVCQTLTAKDFSDASHGAACEAIGNLYRSGVAVYDSTIALRELGAIIGSDRAMGHISDMLGIPNIATFQWHVDRIRNLSRLRAVIAFAGEVKDEVLAVNSKADDVLAWMEARTMRLRQGVTSSAKPFAAVMDEVIEDYQSRVGKPETLVMMSGLPSADRCGFVFGSGELAILAARPGIGKTALATQIGLHHANKGRAVLMASLEMKDRALVSRVLVSRSGQNHQTLRTEVIIQEHVDRLRIARRSIGEPPLFVWSPGRVRAGMIHAAAAVLKATHNLRLLIVDYLGLVRADDPSRPRHEQVGETVKALRDIGIQLDIPVLCLCQLNREADGAEPKLSNLRESGDIEQDADCVAFLHVPAPDFETQVKLIVAKGRQGSKGSTILEFNPEATHFSEPSATWTPDDSRHRD